MSNWQATIGIVAGCVYLLGFVPYLIALRQGKTRPNRATWWIWAIVGLILVVSYRSSGASNTIWVPVSATVCHITIAIASLRYGEGGWNRFDRTCLLGAGISLFFWWQLKSSLIALSINIAIDFLGALPTIRKSYHEPETEDLLSWMLFLAASTLNLFAIENWSFELFAYPFYLFCVPTTVVAFLLRSRMRLQLTSRKRRWRKVGKRKRSHFLSKKRL